MGTYMGMNNVHEGTYPYTAATLATMTTEKKASHKYTVYILPNQMHTVTTAGCKYSVSTQDID